MAAVWLSKFSRFVEGLLNAKGGPVLTDVDSLLKVVFPLFTGNEDRGPQGWNRFAFFTSVTGGAGQNAALQLRNPVGTNVVAVVERMEARVGVTTSSSIQFGFQAGPAGIADLTTVGVAQRLDGRINSGSSLIVSSTTNGTILTPVIISGSVNSGLPYAPIETVNQELVLMPGSAVMILDLTVAEALSASFMWRERALQQSELT